MQGWVSVESSSRFGQSAPPLEGAGLLHSLVLVWFPPGPQVTVHSENAVQSLQLPSMAPGPVCLQMKSIRTKSKKRSKNYITLKHEQGENH